MAKPAVCSFHTRWLTSVEYDGSVSYALSLCAAPAGLFNFLAEAIRGSPTLWLMVHVLVSFVLKSELSCFLPSAKTRVSRTASLIYLITQLTEDRAKRDPRKLTISCCPLMKLLRNRVIPTPSLAFKSMDTGLVKFSKRELWKNTML